MCIKKSRFQRLLSQKAMSNGCIPLTISLVAELNFTIHPTFKKNELIKDKM